MVSLTERLGLRKPTGSEPFKRADIEFNWDLLDEAPGVLPCTSTTRPSWDESKADRLIIESDTGAIYRWDGENWQPTRVKQDFVRGGNSSVSIPDTNRVALSGLVLSVILDAPKTFIVTAVVDIISAQDGGIMVELDLDATPQTGRLLARYGATGGTLSQQWKILVPSGTHTMRLYARKIEIPVVGGPTSEPYTIQPGSIYLQNSSLRAEEQ